MLTTRGTMGTPGPRRRWLMAREPIDAARREARALLGSHLAARGRRHHATRHCPHCHRLLRLAMAAAPREVARKHK
ncbi:DUF6274 family protein [Streptomyces sp. 8N114]|uniref:DUF6274 family protein n=1 Tax=Streptomyces sp. 8N114 TaxID=3457419 RepID=UPI003FD17852